ncbi:hypothetical protein [Streptomyces sp. NPDC053560]|uniref:hypothetical protein n=1 Tax=Streptomyces sp. NPDC053560 TaxID=3365711 RepID=UPI0037D117E9
MGAAQLPRTALRFRGLNIQLRMFQLRMFISFLGLDHADACDRIVRQDTAILEALRNRSAPDAVRQWRAKIAYMVRYMSAQLLQEDFDAPLAHHHRHQGHHRPVTSPGWLCIYKSDRLQRKQLLDRTSGGSEDLSCGSSVGSAAGMEHRLIGGRIVERRD